MAETNVHPGSWLGDAVEEFKKLPLAGKFAAIALIIGAAGFGIYEHRKNAATQSSTGALSSGLAAQGTASGSSGGSTGGTSGSTGGTDTSGTSGGTTPGGTTPPGSTPPGGTISNLIDASIRGRGSLHVSDPTIQQGITNWENTASGIEYFDKSGTKLGTLGFGSNIQYDPNAVQITGTPSYQGQSDLFYMAYNNGQSVGYVNQENIVPTGQTVNLGMQPRAKSNVSTSQPAKSPNAGGGGFNTYTIQPGDIFPEIVYKLGISKPWQEVAKMNMHINPLKPMPGQKLKY